MSRPPDRTEVLVPTRAGAHGWARITPAVIALLSAGSLVACGSSPAPAPSSSQRPSATESSASPSATPPTPGSSPSASATGASPTPRLLSANGLAYGQVVVLAAQRLVGVLVTNTTSAVISASSKATFADAAGTTIATGEGAVSYLRPAEQRILILSLDATPGAKDLLTISPDSVVTEDQPPAAARAAPLIHFGTPKVKAGSVPQLLVAVTNGDSVAHSMTLSSPVLLGGRLVGFASGELDALGPGQTGQASLAIFGPVAPKDTFAPAVELLT